MVRDIELQILTPKRLRSRDQATAVLDLLCEPAYGLVPAKWDLYEPIRRPFECKDYEAILDEWGMSFLWTRKQPRCQGSVWPSRFPVHGHGWITVTVRAEGFGVEGLIRFAQEASAALEAHFCFLHLLTEPEIAFGRQNGTVGCLDPKRGRYAITLPSRKLKMRIPDLYWGTVLGQPYVELFGKERLLSAPAFDLREIGGGCIYIQLSESIYDLETDYERVDGVRQAVKKHLDCNAFFDPDAPEGHVYNVPEFKIEPLPNEEN